MARYSPIAPIALLEEMQEKKILGNYILLLAHDVLKEPIRYENLILNMRDFDNEEDDSFVIMDNSVVELGQAMYAEDVVEAACVVEANCIMTPDSLGGFDATVALIEDQAATLETCNFPLMRVPQGATYEELEQCVAWIHDYLPAEDNKPEYWGIPRWITNELKSRAEVICYISSTIPRAQIHLLGMSNSYLDDTMCAVHPQVMGIDSANPVVMGQDGMDMIHQPWIHMTRGNYWDDIELARTAILNVEHMHNAVST